VKFLHLTYAFEYNEAIEEILDEHDVGRYVRYPRTHGSDPWGKHFGSQVFPGNFAVVQALVDDDRCGALLDALREFRDARESHRGTMAAVLDITEVL